MLKDGLSHGHSIKAIHSQKPPIRASHGTDGSRRADEHPNNDDTVDGLADAILATVRDAGHRPQMVAKVKAVVDKSLRYRMARLHGQIKEELAAQR